MNYEIIENEKRFLPYRIGSAVCLKKKFLHSYSDQIGIVVNVNKSELYDFQYSVTWITDIYQSGKTMPHNAWWPHEDLILIVDPLEYISLRDDKFLLEKNV